MVDRTAAFSPDSKILATGGVGAKLWNAESGNLRKSLMDGFPHSVKHIRFLPNSNSLVTGGAAQIDMSHAPELLIWDIEKGTTTASFNGLKTWITAVDISPEQHLIATASWLHGANVSTVKVWDHETQKELLTLEFKGHVEDVSFTPGGDRIVTRNGTSIQFWTVKPGKGQHATTLSEEVHSFTFSPKGDKFATRHGAFSQETHMWIPEVKIWDVKTLTQVASISGEAHATEFARANKPPFSFSPNGKMLVIAYWDGAVTVYNVDTLINKSKK